ncbi:MAG: paraquat-inducible protein A [Sulfurovum sp.]
MRPIKPIIANIFSCLLVALTIILLIVTLSSVKDIIYANQENRLLKEDYSELHSVQYGLFNSTIWEEKVFFIINEKIDEFNFTKSNRAEIKKYIQTILDTLIIEADRTIRRQNRHKRGFFSNLLGSTKQIITDSLIDIKDLRKKVPQFTDAVMNELERPESQELLKTVLREKLHQLTKDNLAHTDMSAYNAILKKYHSKTFESGSIILDRKLHKKDREIDRLAINILAMVLMIIFLIIIQGRKLKSISLIILSGASLSLLVSGIFLPMLDIEAKIDKLYFTLLDKPLTFTDQILFFKSKSIYDLVHLLMQSEQDKMIFVGILLTTFSVIFPVLKLISTYLYFYIRNSIGDNPITRFFALRSTKWSMADVMVVSIFMAYLGLDGVVSSQLEILKEKSQPINVITTNGTELQVGFYLFLGFVITSFIMALLVESSRKSDIK